MASGVSVVILTLNEEANIAQAIDSVSGWADAVFVFDSWSSDRTVEIAESRGAVVMRHNFENYGSQRNAALESLPIQTEWVFFLDADEWVPEELKSEISDLVASSPPENGFFVRWRMVWMGRWIRRGYYGKWILRLFRIGKARCESRSVNEHLVVNPPLGYLKNDFVHEDRRPLGDWILKHDRYATREAEELFRSSDEGQIPARLFGSQAERVRWVRTRVWNRLPPLARPFGYFGWRYFLRGGILDGKEALVYHFLQALWFPLLIDAKYLELRRTGERSGGSKPEGG